MLYSSIFLPCLGLYVDEDEDDDEVDKTIDGVVLKYYSTTSIQGRKQKSENVMMVLEF